MSKVTKLILGAIILTAFVLAFLPDDFGLKSSSKHTNHTAGGNTVQDEANDKAQLAYSYAIDAVKANLKAPSTASFPGIFERKDHIRYHGKGVYEIKSWVEAQNGLGATVKNPFTVVIVADGNEWKVIEVKVG